MIKLRDFIDCKLSIIHFSQGNILFDKISIYLDFGRNLYTKASQRIFGMFLIEESKAWDKNCKHLDHHCSLSKEGQYMANIHLTEENIDQCNFLIKIQQVPKLMRLQKLPLKQMQLCSFFCCSFFFFQFQKFFHSPKSIAFSF